MNTLTKTEKARAGETRFPALTRAILNHLDMAELEDVARHGADAGWPGFTYYSDTGAFFQTHKADILALAKQDAEDMGTDMLEMIRGFRCLGNNGKPDYSMAEIGEAIYAGAGECADVIQNAMAWFALEEVARELHP